VTEPLSGHVGYAPSARGWNSTPGQHVIQYAYLGVAGQTLDLLDIWGGELTFADVPAEARPLLRHSAIMAEAARDPRFKKRTLTHLYNERPTWLKLAHEKLDRAVLAAYAAIDPDGGWSEDWATVWIETGAGQPPPEPPGDASPADRAAADELAARRKEIDQRVLANLLRMNLARAAQG